MSDTRNGRQRCLDEALEAVNSKRNKEYGEPQQNFEVIAGLQKFVMNCPIPELRAVLLQQAVKMARLINNPYHQDSWKDMAGYAAIGYELCMPTIAGVNMSKVTDVGKPYDDRYDRTNAAIDKAQYR